MGSIPANLDFFVHIRIIVGMVLGLSLARVINGIAGFIQHPNENKIYPIHFGWAIFMLLAIIHFWWYEFSLVATVHWRFDLYVFVIFYAFVFAMICAVLFPDHLRDYTGYEHYFRSRRKWFYGLMVLMFVVDTIDSWIKGPQYLAWLGDVYVFRQVAFLSCSIIAMFWSNKIYHLVFVVVALVCETLWIFHYFDK